MLAVNCRVFEDLQRHDFQEIWSLVRRESFAPPHRDKLGLENQHAVNGLLELRYSDLFVSKSDQGIHSVE